MQPLWIRAAFGFLPPVGNCTALYRCRLIGWCLSRPPVLFAAVVATDGIGVFLHCLRDAQTYDTWKLHKHLNEEDLFNRTRNANELREIMIHVAHALMAVHWLPFVAVAGWVVGLCVPNRPKKDKSMSRHAEFVEYTSKTGLPFPRTAMNAVASTAT
jgi:hypothetical protein